MSDQTPTIKGIFIRSHISGIQKEKGDEGVRLLTEKYGKPLDFKNSDNVPIREEVRLLEIAVEILNQGTISTEKISYEAGVLHFKNFLTTPIARILFPFFKNQFKLLMLQTRNIAGHIFEGVNFTAEDLGERSVRIRLENNDYPLEHFQGLFQEWMNYSGLHGTVEAAKVDNTYEYTMKWD